MRPAQVAITALLAAFLVSKAASAYDRLECTTEGDHPSTVELTVRGNAGVFTITRPSEVETWPVNCWRSVCYYEQTFANGDIVYFTIFVENNRLHWVEVDPSSSMSQVWSYGAHCTN